MQESGVRADAAPVMCACMNGGLFTAASCSLIPDMILLCKTFTDELTFARSMVFKV